MLSQFTEHIEPIDKIDNVIGVLIGMAIKDNILSLKYLLNLLPEQGVDARLIRGAYGFIAKEPLLERDMRHVLQSLNVDMSLAIDLVKLVSNKEDIDRFNPALRICKKQCKSARVVSSLTAIMKGDLSNIDCIADKLKVDPHTLSVVGACAKRQYKLLTNSFEFISQTLDIKDVKATKTIISIACGNTEGIQDLSKY